MLPVVRSMAKLGATDVEIAAALKVSLSAVELWARQHTDFLRALKPPKRTADDRVERSLFRRATGYSYDSEDVFQYEGKAVRVPIVKHVPPDTTAAIFWLKNRRKDLWRDFKATELSTPPGRPLEVSRVGPSEPELIGAYYERLAKQTGRSAPGRPAGTDPSADPGVDHRGQGPDRPRGGPKADQG
jgi:hypothetical protein